MKKYIVGACVAIGLAWFLSYAFIEDWQQRHAPQRHGIMYVDLDAPTRTLIEIKTGDTVVFFHQPRAGTSVTVAKFDPSWDIGGSKKADLTQLDVNASGSGNFGAPTGSEVVAVFRANDDGYQRIKVSYLIPGPNHLPTDMEMGILVSY
jgi:hypothetical protein